MPKRGRTFASPPEPLFGLSRLNLSTDIIDEWLSCLIEKSTIKAASLVGNNGHFSSGNSAEFIFQLGEKLELTSTTKYLAAEILDKFMVIHLQGLFNRVIECGKDLETEEWKRVMHRVKAQLPLRILSCCQIASKLETHRQIVSQKRAIAMLKELGHRFGKDSLLQSELRLLKTISYRASILTPIVLVETLIAVLEFSSRKIDAKKIYGAALHITDFLYIHNSIVTKALVNILRQKSNSKNRKGSRFKDHGKCCLLLKSCAIVATSVYIIHTDLVEKTIEKMAAMMKLSREDILSCTAVFIHFMFRNESKLRSVSTHRSKHKESH